MMFAPFCVKGEVVFFFFLFKGVIKSMLIVWVFFFKEDVFLKMTSKLRDIKVKLI